MGQSVNTSYSVILLGDRDTAAFDGLMERAAQQGATIIETHSFDQGEAASHDDLTEVDAVLGALSRAIATGTDIWVPFPVQDLLREQHIRRLIVVLQRHGLNMLMGYDLAPCPAEGGMSPIDCALREEVRAVDALDHAAIAAASVEVLGAEIEQALIRAGRHRRRTVAAEDMPHEAVGVGEKFYSTSDVARFFGKSVRWVYESMRSGAFTHSDGSPIEPLRIGNGHRRFSVTVLRDMTESCYRRGVFGEEELLDLLAVLSRTEQD